MKVLRTASLGPNFCGFCLKKSLKADFRVPGSKGIVK